MENYLKDIDLENLAVNELIAYEIEKLYKITDKWGFYRQLYMENIGSILEVSSRDRKKYSQVYYLDWSKHFSPIELKAWNSMRIIGHIPLYPQFPLFNHFIDFANPSLKLGLETDGDKWHSKEKDLSRDNKLKRFGWKIFRVTGSEVNKSYLDITEIEEEGLVGKEKKEAIEHWIMNTCDGLINAIKYWYFLNKDEKISRYSYRLYAEEDSEIIDFKSLAKESLIKHQLAKFDIGKPYK